MDRLILILIAYCHLLSVHAQVYFNERYNFNGVEALKSVLEIDMGYLCVGGAVTTDQGVLLYSIDKQGNTLTQKFYSEPGNILYSGGPGSLIETVDGGYALAGSDFNNAMLWKFDDTGDTLWTKRYGDNSQQLAKQCKQTADGGYIIIGVTTTYDPDGDFWLIKTDSLGNMEWDTTYGGVEFEFGVSVDVAKDGGYIVVGATDSYGQDIGSTSDIYVIKVDSVGIEQWSGVYGGPYGDAVWNVESTSDGGYIVGGGLVETDAGPLSRPYLIKLDSAGNTEWDNVYGPLSFATTLNMVRELTDGSFIGVGQGDDGAFQIPGLLLKVSSQGDSLWYRLPVNLNGSESTNYLEDIQPTSDGGFIAAGWVVPTDPGDTGNQDMWVMKLDSMGCEVENCLVGVEEFEAPHIEMKVYPNPFSENATIEFDTPPFSGQTKLVIYDVTGREIKTYELQKSQSSVIVSAAEIGNGLFFIQLVSSGEILASKKLIITR